MRGVFVTGTDTGAGKTVLSAALLAALRAAGEPALAYKPVLTGLEEPPEPPWPRDHELLGAAAGLDPLEVAPLRYGPAVSPHLAAELSGRALDPAALEREALARSARAEGEHAALIVEGVGGLMVPLSGGYLVRDLARALALPLLVAARPGLGTINHTLLTLEAARAAGLHPLAVVLTPWPQRPGEIERSNRETIAALGEVEVQTLAELDGPDQRQLARAGEGLPWRRWLAGPG